ncbi:type II secretory pathway, component PulD, partial [Paludisphaera sp.]|uniref:type II secretory pathway, component PulD n=1 Tax=Paludisphaera sp. TaxID=2017432 RepID=UPI00301E4872
MRRLRALTVTMILGAVGGASTEGAAPDELAASPSTTARKPAPAPPVKYLEAGSRLFNSGQFDLAAKYLDAAQMYRDELEPEHQKLLDDYVRELKRVKGAAPAATPPATTPAPAERPVAVTATPSAPPVASRTGTTEGEEPDLKQKGRWLLQEAGELIMTGDYDAAEAKIDEADALGVKWGLFDSTPAKARQALAKARPKADPAAAAPTKVVDHKAAKARLAEARAALADRQFESAEAIALEVKGWGLSYGMFEDNPDKVAAAARALRKRDAIRGADPKEQSSPGVYDVLVQESRQLVKVGKLAEAEAKARQAQAMNVVPALTADRAEAVLHEIALIKAAPTAPAAESAADAAELEADALLARNDQAAAAAKFAEAQRLRSAERGATNPPLDLAVVKSGVDPIELDAPGDDEEGEDADGPDLDPVPAALPAPDLELAPAPAADDDAPAGPGAAAIGQAQALYSEGNYAAARQAAEKARAEGAGVEAEEISAQIDLAEQGGALSLYEAALASLRGGDRDRARTLLTEVASAGPVLDDNLQAKVQELLKSLTTDQIGDPAGRAVVNDRMASADDGDSIAAQKLNAEVGAKIAEARRLQETDPDKALAIYETTLKAVKASEIPPNLQKPMVRRLEVAVELAKKDKSIFDEKMKDKGYREEIERKRLRILEADSAKKSRYKELFDKAQAAYGDGEFHKAEQYAKQAMEIDPTEVAAPMMVFKAKAERRYKTDMKNRSAKEEGFVTAMQNVDAAAAVDAEVLTRDISFPTSFRELTNSRREMVKSLEPRKDARTLAVEAKLREPITVNFDKQPLGEAVAFIANYTGLNVQLDPRALTDEGLTSSTPVDLKLQNVRLKTVLKLMLSPLGLSYTTEDEVLLITNKQATRQDTFFHTYYVADLIKSKEADPSKIARGMNPTPAARSVDAQGMPLLGAGAGGTSVDEGAKPEISDADMMPLIQLITSSIAPGTWRIQDGDGRDVSSAYGLGGAFGGGGLGGDDIDEGRPPGSITPFFLSISLIIRHTAEVHDQVADLLRQLRRLQDLQVSIEVRFITVTDSFFEQIGVDFDFAINSKSVGKQSTWAFPSNAVTGDIGGGGTTTGGGGIGGGTTGGGVGGGTTGGGIGGGGIGGGGIGGGGIGGGG